MQPTPPGVVEQDPAALRVAAVGEGKRGVIVRLPSAGVGREQSGEIGVAGVEGLQFEDDRGGQGARRQPLSDLRPHFLPDRRQGLAALVAHAGGLRPQALEIDLQRAGVGHAAQGGDRLRPRLGPPVRLQQRGHRGLRPERSQGVHGLSRRTPRSASRSAEIRASCARSPPIRARATTAAARTSTAG